MKWQYTPGLHITLENAEPIVAVRFAFYQALEAPVLIRKARVKSIEKAAKDFFFAPEKGLRNSKAVAIVHSNIVSCLMASMIFHRHIPAVPHKMFTVNKRQYPCSNNSYDKQV